MKLVHGAKSLGDHWPIKLNDYNHDMLTFSEVPLGRPANCVQGKDSVKVTRTLPLSLHFPLPILLSTKYSVMLRGPTGKGGHAQSSFVPR